MRKRVVVGVISAGVLLVGVMSGNSNPAPANLTNAQPVTTAVKATPTPKVDSVCDGSTITKNCTVDGVSYITYMYHPAIPAKTHTETITTYREEVADYCTLCVDGTYSPSCATGRGACSHHGGVAQWNSPRYKSVPEHTTSTIIDAPAQDAYYEKVAR